MANRTAYEEALNKIQSGEDPTGASIPKYISSADTLNIANNNKTFLQSAGDVVEAIPQFIGASLVSGANQLYNIPADIGNLFGGDFERSDTGEVIASLDSNLGAFYQENQAGVDLVGFMVSSLVPGTAAVKVLNAGQKSLRTAIGAGKFGENTGKALGLLAPNKALNIEKAIQEVATGSSAASLLNGSALKAMGAGLGQGTLEALAFETAVAATLFKSPILENQDFGDFVINVAFGAGVFGLIGGTIDATKISFSLKRTADKASIEARPWEFIAEPASASTSYEKVVLDFEQLNNIPPIPAGVDTARQVFLKNAADTKTRVLEGRIRRELGVMSAGDQDVAETMFRSFKQSSEELQTAKEFVGPRFSSLTDQQTAFIGLVETTKFNATSKIVARAENLSEKINFGKATVKEIEEFAESTISVGYVKTWGEDAGRVTIEKPVITSLIDTLKKGQQIKVSKTGVSITKGGRSFSFNTRFNIGAKAGTKAAGAQFNILKTDPIEAQARYIWAQNLDTFVPTAKQNITVNVNDIPLLEKVLLDVAEKDLIHVRFTGLDKGEQIGISLQEFVAARKLQVAIKILDIGGEGAKTQDEIAAIVNIKSSLLNGEVKLSPNSTYHLDDILAMQSHAETYTKRLVNQGTRRAKDGVVNIWEIPQTIKLTYDSQPFAGINNHVVENMAIIKEQQKLYQEGTSRAAAQVLGDDFARLEEINSGKVFAGAVPSGAGAGLASAASANYGTLAASVENIGAITARMIGKFKDRARESLEPVLYKLGNNQEAAIEWSTLNSRVRGIEGQYGLNTAGDALEPLAIIRWKKATAEAQEAGTTPPARPVLSNPAMELRIELKNQEVRELTKVHIEINQTRTNDLAGIRTAQGLQFNRDPDAFFPIPVNPKDFPNFALVIDESVTSGNHTKTLFATSGEELKDMISKLKENPQLTILTKGEAERHFKDVGQFDYEKTLSNNYLDVEAHRKGVSAPFLVSTDPRKITNDLLDWHMQRETGLVREAVAAKYEVQFEELKQLGKQFTDVELSKFSDISLLKFAEDAVKNPFGDYIKTALAISKTTDYPWWIDVNKRADAAISNVLKRATAVMENAKTPEELASINKMLEKAGYKGAAYDESMEIFANSQPARGALTNTVRKANGIMATIVLRWDALNAVNNAVSANVLLGAETKAVVRAINRGDAEAVGALAQLTRMKVPGTAESIMAPTRLVANAVKKFGRIDRKSAEFKFFEDNGFLTTISKQYTGALDELAFTGRENISAWNKRVDGVHKGLRDLADKGERWTGNRLAEEFNRFVAADVMKQMTDVAVSRNLMTPKEQLAYINTFVNRTQGNYTAAQRPMMFQGPIGQSIGLFQTYQFNLMQQLLRHVGEGGGKDAMTLLGLQGTIHGMNGLPAFNAVNTSLIGNASGNKEHRDAFDALYGIAGKEAGDWLMYGIGSNAMGLLHPDLKVNLYTRGDINPRHLTIIPTNPSSVPIIQATAKVFGNLFSTAKKLVAGGDVTTTLLQGLEHNGLSRPLAGLAQALEGLDNPQAASYSTSKRGNVIGANDLFSLTNLGRIVGGKPLDEAIALDATFRFKTYGLADAKKRQALGQAIKTTMIAGKDPSQEQIEDFAEDYAKLGGRQEEFNKWFTQLYKTANLSQANKIQQNLKSPFAIKMQQIMGGRELRDFTD